MLFTPYDTIELVEGYKSKLTPQMELYQNRLKQLTNSPPKLYVAEGENLKLVQLKDIDDYLNLESISAITRNTQAELAFCDMYLYFRKMFDDLDRSHSLHCLKCGNSIGTGVELYNLDPETKTPLSLGALLECCNCGTYITVRLVMRMVDFKAVKSKDIDWLWKQSNTDVGSEGSQQTVQK